MKNPTALVLRRRLALCLLVVAPLVTNAWSQSNQTGVLAPPRTDLIAVHLPDTSGMEAEVREHLRSAEQALVATIKTPNAPAAKLAEAYGLTGQIFHAYALHAPARESYTNAARLAPKDFRWTYLLGKLRELEGEAEAAIELYQTARSLRPDYLPVLVNLGNIYLQLNRPEEAETFFKGALQSGATSGAALYGLGQAALSKRNYAEAVRHLEAALRLAPEANRIHYALGMSYRGLGDVERAKSHLARRGVVGVRAADPLVDGLQELVKGARLHLARGRVALEARRYSDAAAEFRKALAQQPDSIPANFNLGVSLFQTGDVEGAIAQFEKTLALEPTHANAHYNLGIIYAQIRRPKEAAAHLAVAIKEEPGDMSARFLLAQELVKLNRTEEADAELARVVAADPANEDALLARVKLLLQQKQYAQALEVAERGHARAPQKGRTIATLAHLLAASPQIDLRDGARALTLAQAVYAATADPNHGALVALALAELGRCDEAAALTRRMLTEASGAKQPDLAEKLKAQLDRYERVRPCRAAAAEINSNEEATPR